MFYGQNNLIGQRIIENSEFFFRKTCDDQRIVKDVSFEEIMKICGILDANCFRIDRNGTRGLFLATSMINHDCLPNARIIFNAKGKLWTS